MKELKLTLFEIVFTGAILVLMSIAIKADPIQGYSQRNVLDAIRQVETGGCPNNGIGAVGDRGKAIGPYQIHNIYFIDAKERDKKLTQYTKCKTSVKYSESVVSSYMNRYARKEWARLASGKGSKGDCETVARIHNGGPRGAYKALTKKYWIKVDKHL